MTAAAWLWTRSRPLSRAPIDAAVAGLLAVGSLGELLALHHRGFVALAVVACLAGPAAVAVRRRAVTAAPVVALAALLLYVLATRDTDLAVPPVTAALTCYTLGRWGSRLLPMVAVALSALGVYGAIAIDLGEMSVTKVVSAWALLALAPGWAGVVVARRAALSARLAVAAAGLSAEEDLHPERAAAEERNRVARELHDVITHGVSVMVIQAGAARLVALKDPAAARSALQVIEAAGRDTLMDLRRIVGVLRRADDPVAGWGAGLGTVDRLVERIRAAGIPVDLSVEGTLDRVPPSVDLVAYRVVQEALTNVVKHAGATASAHVHVRVGAASLYLTVTDTGTGDVCQRPAGSGHGLVGMRERLALYGGDLSAAPRAEGGYEVRARVPLTAAVARRRHGPARAAKLPRRPRLPRWVVEIAPAVAWLTALEAEAATSSARHGPLLTNAVVVAAMALAAGWRRRWPLAFVAVVGALAVVLSAGLTSLDKATLTGLYVVAVPLFTVAAWAPRPRAVAGLTLWAAGAVLIGIIRHAPAAAFAGATAMGLLAWAAGRIWYSQRTLSEELVETTTRLAAAREEGARLAVIAERARIARDLHGLVAQSVAAMVVQAAAAQEILSRDPGGTSEGIRAIEDTGRWALTRLRDILGVLRARPDVHQEVPA